MPMLMIPAGLWGLSGSSADSDSRGVLAGEGTLDCGAEWDMVMGSRG